MNRALNGKAVAGLVALQVVDHIVARRIARFDGVGIGQPAIELQAAGENSLNEFQAWSQAPPGAG